MTGQLDRRVVVTGLGCVSPLGNDADATFGALLEGRSAIRRVTRFDAGHFECRIAAEVTGFDVGRYVPVPKDARRMDPFVHYAIAAGDMAVRDSGLEPADIDRDRAGVVFGTAFGGSQTAEAQARVLEREGPHAVSAFLVPMFLGNLSAGHLAIRYGLRGPNIHVSTACASGTHAIGEAMDIIGRGDADVVLAGAAEAAITPLILAGFDAARSLSRNNDHPEEASRPFDLERDGFVLGDGAGALVLEELEHARRRGARVLAELVGYARSGDAHHVTAPDPTGDGARRSMQGALRRARLRPEDVDYVNAHGTSTLMGDRAETQAIKAVFGDHATSRRLWISSTKSMIGHLLGAAGAVEAVVCVKSIAEGKVHPTINQRAADPGCDLDYVANCARDRRVRAAISNSFGFGGHNGTLAFAAFSG